MNELPAILISPSARGEMCVHDGTSDLFRGWSTTSLCNISRLIIIVERGRQDTHTARREIGRSDHLACCAFTNWCCGIIFSTYRQTTRLFIISRERYSALVGHVSPPQSIKVFTVFTINQQEKTNWQEFYDQCDVTFIFSRWISSFSHMSIDVCSGDVKEIPPPPPSGLS